MKTAFICLAVLLLLTSCTKKINLVNAGQMSKISYRDTIPLHDEHGLISVTATVNGKNKRLIFDTGADLLLLGKDSLSKPSNIHAKSNDSNGNTSSTQIDKEETLQIADMT